MKIDLIVEVLGHYLGDELGLALDSVLNIVDQSLGLAANVVADSSAMRWERPNRNGVGLNMSHSREGR
jgi:hypothetical protein